MSLPPHPHHHHHLLLHIMLHHHPPPTTPTTHYPPPPPPNPLIHSISIHHHPHHQHAPPQNHQHAPPQIHQSHHLYPNYYYHHQQQNIQENETPPPPLTPTVSSLIHRISALESSLLHRRRKHSPTPSSLRDAAARTIQTHFRAFLVRRSATLRHLKNLANIKSALNRLKSSVSNKTHFDAHTLSRESMGLLIKLDSIQGSDPMIRDGKRAISRELIRFMEVLDEMCTESQVIAVKNVRVGKSSNRFLINERKLLETLKNQRKYINEVEERLNLENPRKVGAGQIRIGDLTKSQGKSQQKVKKNVSFDENGNVYRLFKSSRTPVSSDGSGSSNGDDEEVEVEVEEIGVSSKEREVEEDESSEMSENEMDPRKNLRTRIPRTTEKKQPDQEDDDDEDDSFVFSAPLPAKMEY